MAVKNDPADTVFDTDGLQLLERSGTGRVELAGKYSAESLTQLMLDRWIPYLDCDECGRSNYCGYTVKSPYRPSRKKDIQCGVVRTALGNFLIYTSHVFLGSDLSVRQAYLDAAFYFSQFVYHSELQVGNFLEPDILDWWESLAPKAFGQIVGLREHLDNFARALSRVPDLGGRQEILLVEGPSEVAFLNSLRRSGQGCFLFYEVACYYGKNNRRPNKLQLLLERYRLDGYNVYVQGDADGKPNPGQALSTLSSLSLSRLFFFQQDFESSLPTWLIEAALAYLGWLPDSLEPKLFTQTLEQRGPGSVLMALKDIGVDLGEQGKVEFAEAVGEVIANMHQPWWTDEQFVGTEIGSFLLFLQSIGRDEH